MSKLTNKYQQVLSVARSHFYAHAAKMGEQDAKDMAEVKRFITKFFILRQDHQMIEYVLDHPEKLEQAIHKAIHEVVDKALADIKSFQSFTEGYKKEFTDVPVVEDRDHVVSTGISCSEQYYMGLDKQHFEDAKLVFIDFGTTPPSTVECGAAEKLTKVEPPVGQCPICRKFYQLSEGKFCNECCNREYDALGAKELHDTYMATGEHPANVLRDIDDETYGPSEDQEYVTLGQKFIDLFSYLFLRAVELCAIVICVPLILLGLLSRLAAYLFFVLPWWFSGAHKDDSLKKYSNWVFNNFKL